MSEWISIEDKLPENEYDYVFVNLLHGQNCVANYSRDRHNDVIRWFHVTGHHINQPVTHWMPLPKSLE